jgi:hypothetical protein
VDVSDVVLLQARSLDQAFPGRWWLPAPGLLDQLELGRTDVKVLALPLGPDHNPDPWAAKTIWVTIDSREDDCLLGAIRTTELDRDGYRVGDRIALPPDRVIDLVFVGGDGHRLLNESRARFMVDKRALVGLTVLSQSGDLIEQSQFLGTIADVDPARGIELVLDDQSSYWLPPDVRAFQEAPPGEYTLRSTGQTVVDPDYVSTWTVTRPDASYSPTAGRIPVKLTSSTIHARVSPDAFSEMHARRGRNYTHDAASSGTNCRCRHKHMVCAPPDGRPVACARRPAGPAREQAREAQGKSGRFSRRPHQPAVAHRFPVDAGGAGECRDPAARGWLSNPSGRADRSISRWLLTEATCWFRTPISLIDGRQARNDRCLVHVGPRVNPTILNAMPSPSQRDLESH